MPIYEYECAGCGKRFEVFQKISDKPITKCKFCKGTLNKLISTCSFQLKGTGWYATDYKKPVDSVGKKVSSGNGSDRTDTAETNKTTSTEAKTEAKSETKTEAKSESATT